MKVLPSVDAQGRAVAGAFGREAAGQGALPPGDTRPLSRVQIWKLMYMKGWRGPLGGRPPARARFRRVRSLEGMWGH